MKIVATALAGLILAGCSSEPDYSLGDYLDSLPATVECQDFRSQALEELEQYGRLEVDDKGNLYSPDMTIKERASLSSAGAICNISGILGSAE